MTGTESERGQWAVQLDGDHIDLIEWERALPDLSDFHMVKVPQGDRSVFGLTGPALQEATEAAEVRAKARGFVEQMNGVMWLVCRAQPVSLGNTVFTLGAGSVGVHIFLEFSDVVRLGGLHPIVTVQQPDGSVIASTPGTDPVYRQALLAAESSDEVADLLVQAGRADNWFDLYKAIELAERLAGGETALRKLLGAQGKTFKQVRTTANFFRHARAHRPVPMSTLSEAHDLLAEVVGIVLRRLP